MEQYEIEHIYKKICDRYPNANVFKLRNDNKSYQCFTLSGSGLCLLMIIYIPTMFCCVYNPISRTLVDSFEI